MTYYSTCLNCAADKAQCERRKSLSAALKGTGVTSLKFKCADRQSLFERGQRVEFDWTYYEDNEGYQPVFVGTVMGEKPNRKRFNIRVDQDHDDYDLKPADVLKSPEFVSVRPADMRQIEEPRRHMCALCSAYNNESDRAQICYQIGVTVKDARCDLNISGVTL
jgi:hypothetical protein